MRVSVIPYVEGMEYHLCVDNSMLTAAVTCPRKYNIRYQRDRVPVLGARQVPLEAGRACHDVFAAVRLWDLGEHQGLWEHAGHWGRKLYGPGRYLEMLNAIDANKEKQLQAMDFALTALETSGFEDDPYDRKRTMVNMEESLLAYIERWEWGKRPIWVADKDDPTAPIGVEFKIDCLITFFDPASGHERIIRFIGRIDGLHYDKQGNLEAQENKTASRLADWWVRMWDVNHQPTGYCVLASALLNETVSRARVIGMSIPLPRSGYDYGGISDIPMTKYEHDFRAWLNYVYHVVEHNIIPWREKPYQEIPMYTHSCGNYFRLCSYHSLCTSYPDETEELIEDMPIDVWDPIADEGSNE